MRGYNYDEKYVGATSEAPWSADRVDQLKRDGFIINHTRVKVGAGPHAFARAKDKLQNWRHLQLGWASVDPSTPIKVGGKFGIVVHEMVAWLVNPLQVAYLRDGQEEAETTRSSVEQRNEVKPATSRASQAFAFGGSTLRGHLLCGVTVAYEIYALCRMGEFDIQHFSCIRTVFAYQEVMGRFCF
ncbi:hypothetical protein R1flu_003710 [Riccia fluitans]|uniref:DUF1990 domain-containing protein n=1 Tax=Riccia fluitans TaxID=41844 RepID=A0ABD1Y9V6_9MARC